MLIRRLLVLSFVLLSGCVTERSQPLPLMAATPAPTPFDWNDGLKGVIFKTGGVECLQVRRANVDDCAKNKRFNLYCIEEDDPASQFSPTTPKGCGVFYMKTLATCGNQIDADLKLKCRIDTDVPQPTASPSPTPAVDPLKPCVDRDPAYCWHVDSRLSGNDCWADCRCVKRSVGPCAGVPTPKPTVKPTPTPGPTAKPTQTPVDPFQFCIDKNPNWCWHRDSLVTSDGSCFSNCVCVKKTVGPCYASVTPVPTPSPRPTPSPTLPPVTTPTGQCPAGSHPVLMCVSDATPVSTVSPRATVTAKPVATPPVVSASFVQGGWFIPECTAVDLFGARSKWYNFPYVFAAFPKGFNKHATDFKEACTPNAEIWNAIISIPNHWNNTTEANIAIADPQVRQMVEQIRQRKQIITDLKAQGVPDAKLPKMPILWIDEGSSYAYGAGQDLYSGGFYKYVNGKRVPKAAKELNPALPPYVEWMVKQYQAEGVTEFAVAPYTFGWANADLRTSLTLATDQTDLRSRRLMVARPQTDKLMGVPSPEQQRQLFETNNPDLWPKGHVWVANPDQVATDAAGHMSIDTPDDVTLKRDSAYYTLYLYALKGQHPEVTRSIGQLSNCVYNRRDDSPHWAIAKSMLISNIAFGYPADIQIEGCKAKVNTDAGRAWNAPLADCRAMKAIKAFDGNVIPSLWLTDIKSGLQLDFRSCP